ncbi:hypothetical protein JCM11641_007676 [Rhodosporidiobolus odoratus]
MSLLALFDSPPPATDSHTFASSHKAQYRPGKAPTHRRNPVQRTASLSSLPSPPSDCDEQDGMDLDGGLEQPPQRRTLVFDHGFNDEEEIDQLESDLDDDDSSMDRAARAASPTAVPAKRRACALGSPANLVGGGGASRRQLLNPFLPAVQASTSQPTASTSVSPVRLDFLHASPTRRRRADPDRIKLAVTPPQKSRADLAEERRRQEEEESKQKKRMMMGWDDPENPFVEKEEDMAKRLRDKQPMKRPETITLVKRGQRIQTSVPFTAVLTSTSPSEDPFTFTAPKLLFPPRATTPPHPSTPPQQSKFLEALRAAGASEKKPAAAGPPGPGGAAQLPPTPVTLKRKATAAAPSGQPGQRYGPYKKMRGLGHAAEGGLR